MLLFTGRHFLERKVPCRKKTAVEFAVFKCEDTTLIPLRGHREQ